MSPSTETLVTKPSNRGAKSDNHQPKTPTLAKAPTGIPGLDEVTGGGFPRGRPTLISGSAGCGKTLLAMEFLVRGATEFQEPGVFIAFEERPEELSTNVRSLGFDLEAMARRKQLVVDYVHVDRSEIEETGEYDLEGLFVRIGYAIDSIGAKRIVIDTIEALFAGLSNDAILRSELRRLFRWLKDKGMTAIITGERGEGALTRRGLEEYVSDCVIVLDHRVSEQLSTRRLRIVKYRGSTHGTNEYPFLIDRDGITVLPITSLGLKHPASPERISTGIPRLDTMLGERGPYRGSSVLISGGAGSGKTSIAAHFADAACKRGERCLYLAFEESQDQIVRNMRSIGLDLAPWIRKGMLRIEASRPTSHSLEMHLTRLHRTVHEFEPGLVIVDPITNFLKAGTSAQAESLLTRLIDFLKAKQVTALLTGLTHGPGAQEESDVGISSIIDTWILLANIDTGSERNRAIYILKARGIGHSNQIREFVLNDRGIELRDVYIGPDGMLTGSSRLAQEARERAESLVRSQEIDVMERALERKRKAMEAQIQALRADFEQEQIEMLQRIRQCRDVETSLVSDRAEMGRSRKADINRKERPNKSGNHRP